MLLVVTRLPREQMIETVIAGIDEPTSSPHGSPAKFLVTSNVRWRLRVRWVPILESCQNAEVRPQLIVNIASGLIYRPPPPRSLVRAAFRWEYDEAT